MLSDSLQIYFFHSGEEIKKYADSLPNFAGCMWKEAFGKKKLQIQKYSDISGRPKCQFENMLQVHMMPGMKANKRRNL